MRLPRRSTSSSGCGGATGAAGVVSISGAMRPSLLPRPGVEARLVADGELALGDRDAVEREHVVELPDDVAQDAGILLERVRVERGHDAAAPWLHDLDLHLADHEPPAHEAALAEPLHAGEHDVR